MCCGAAPLCGVVCRTLSGKTLSHMLQFLEPEQSSLVCKYWCQVSAYLTEKRDNPHLTDDDFEILFDYESQSQSQSQEQGGQGRGNSGGNQDSLHDHDGAELEGGGSNNSKNNHPGSEELNQSQSQSQSDVPGGHSSATGTGGE